MAGVHPGRVRGDAPGIAGVLTVLRDHQGAVTADLRRHYGLGLREALSLPAREFIDLVDRIPPTDSAIARSVLGDSLGSWTPLDENVAMVVDALRNHLQFLWSQWTAPEHARRAARRGRAPKTPPILPYAVRPQELTEARAGQADVASGKPKKAAPGESRTGMRRMSIEELALLV